MSKSIELRMRRRQLAKHKASGLVIVRIRKSSKVQVIGKGTKMHRSLIDLVLAKEEDPISCVCHLEGVNRARLLACKRIIRSEKSSERMKRKARELRKRFKLVLKKQKKLRKELEKSRKRMNQEIVERAKDALADQLKVEIVKKLEERK